MIDKNKDDDLRFRVNARQIDEARFREAVERRQATPHDLEEFAQNDMTVRSHLEAWWDGRFSSFEKMLISCISVLVEEKRKLGPTFDKWRMVQRQGEEEATEEQKKLKALMQEAIDEAERQFTQKLRSRKDD